jgi:type IV secretion system protein VirB5
MKALRTTVLVASTLMSGVVITSPPASAAIPVVDFSAIAQLVTQLRTLQEHLVTARNQLTEAQSTLQSMSGDRGMQNLLTDIARNYLPESVTDLVDVIQNTSANYGKLAAELQQIVGSNAVLPATVLDSYTPAQRQLVTDARNHAAALESLTRAALENTSQRFETIEQLIAAIGDAGDQKAILDLSARVQAETGMLQNENTKLSTLYQNMAAEEQLRSQRVREQGIAGVGSFRDLPPLKL